MIALDQQLSPARLQPAIERFFEMAGGKTRRLAERWDATHGAPVLTRDGIYQPHNWADWTQGFQFGCAILVFEATGDRWFLDWARRGTLDWMPMQLTSVGGHDHGFNNISSYGNLLRLARDGRFAAPKSEIDYYQLALRVSGALQAARWTPLPDGAGSGYIYSFHGPHSLSVNSIRSLRSLAVADQLGQVLASEGDRKISLLERLVRHALTITRYSIFYGEGRDHYDVCGRVAQECIFDVTNGSYRCATTQQGYSPFSTWTRGLAWAMLGFAEQLEFLASLSEPELGPLGGRAAIEPPLLRAAIATSDYYLKHAASDGIPYWDTAAPGLTLIPGYAERASDPWNAYEPVDSSAASAAAQGLWRLGAYLSIDRKATFPHWTSLARHHRRYQQAALRIAATLFAPPYVSDDPLHEGLILHAIYNRPGGWDSIPKGRAIPCGESTLWGDYHALELALLLLRAAGGEHCPMFFDI